MLARHVAVALCAASLMAGPVAVMQAGLAQADCTGAGDFGAGSGCPPPGDTSGSGGGESWPPTSVDWPPSQSADDAGSGSGGGSGSASTPIVMPDGEVAPVKSAHVSDSTTSSTPPTPIVPVGAPPSAAAAAATAIVSPSP